MLSQSTTGLFDRLQSYLRKLLRAMLKGSGETMQRRIAFRVLPTPLAQRRSSFCGRSGPRLHLRVEEHIQPICLRPSLFGD